MTTQEYLMLSSLMCWDAVMHVALLAGVIDDAKYKSSKGRPDTLANSADIQVTDAGAMANLPAGHALVFYETKNGIPVPIHAMISIGGGRAAGNKNDCVGVGKSVGWEVLDLSAGLSWSGGGVQAPLGANPTTGQMVHRAVKVHHRPITGMG
ncbi:MAG: hypothetical protein EXS35_06920 [Pedosphaera sp.]|nr:hypothetical protein [Pedosphaera sp.]